jgi:hypothetical protein
MDLNETPVSCAEYTFKKFVQFGSCITQTGILIIIHLHIFIPTPILNSVQVSIGLWLDLRGSIVG